MPPSPTLWTRVILSPAPTPTTLKTRPFNSTKGKTLTISELTALLRKAKQAETDAKNERLRIEGLITEQFSKPESNEGSHSDEEFTITWKLNRTVNSEKLANDYEDLPETAQKAFRWKAEVNLAYLRSLADIDPAAYNKAAVFITSKPAKPSIELKD